MTKHPSNFVHEFVSSATVAPASDTTLSVVKFTKALPVFSPFVTKTISSSPTVEVVVDVVAGGSPAKDVYTGSPGHASLQ